MLESGQKKIGALVKTSLVDYPQKVAAAVFLHGCNLRCPYCYNVELVNGTPNDYDSVTYDDVINHLKKRKNVLSGFVISGGEPCLSPFLDSLIKDARDLGYFIKLDTNGTFPEKLESIFSNTALIPDFVAMDFKTSPEKYELCGKDAVDKIKKSISIISQLSSEKREFRTVLVPGLVNESDIEAMAHYLPKNAAWRFARFRNDNCIDKNYEKLAPYPQEEIDSLVALAKKYIPDSVLR